MAILRRLNETGISAFRAWLADGAPGEAPADLLTLPSSSEALSTSVEIDERQFASRFELGEYLNERLGKMAFSQIAFDTGIWDWLTLFWFDQIAPANAHGERSLREIARYSQDAGGRRWSRHVVRMSWLSVHNHQSNARYFLSTPLGKHTDVLEQIAGQQEIFGSKAAVALGSSLYWDEEAGVLKKGAGGKSAGSPRRLSRFMKQIRMTYDPEATEPDQLLHLLPKEFNRWRQVSTPDGEAGSKTGILSKIFGRGAPGAANASD